MAPSTDSRYDEARRRFDDLDVEEQASFLVEAAASTLARGVKQAGETLAEGLEDVLRTARRRASRSASSSGPGPAEPETAQRRTPRSRDQKGA